MKRAMISNKADKLRAKIEALQAELDAEESGVYHFYLDKPAPAIDVNNPKEIILHTPAIEAVVFAKKSITFWCGVTKFTMWLADTHQNLSEFTVKTVEG